VGSPELLADHARALDQIGAEDAITVRRRFLMEKGPRRRA